MSQNKKDIERSMYAWVVFYLDEDGAEYAADAIGSSKEQAYGRFKRLWPDCEGTAWKVRRVKMSWSVTP